MRFSPLLSGLLAGLLLAAPSCQKRSDLNQPQAGQNDLAGTWVLYALEGGMAGEVIYSPSQGPVYHFNRSGSFDVTSSGVRLSGTYRLTPANSSNNDKILLLIPADNSSVTRDSVRISDNKLSFLPTGTCCDEAYYVYRRINYFF
jgi:hypothetical protein